MVHQKRLQLTTPGHGAMTDLTSEVALAVAVSGVRTGIVHVFAVGSTAAIGAIEYEPGLKQDLPQTLDRLFPPSKDYAHEQTWHDGNGHSHLQATILGPSLSVPVTGGKPVLGTWQQVFHIDCDIHPRERTVVLTVYGEA